MASIPRPHNLLWKLWNRTSFWDSTIAVGATILGVPTAIKWWNGGSHGWAISVAVLTVIILAASLRKAFIQWKDADSKEAASELEGCLHTLRSILLMGCNAADVGMRLTIHVADGEKYIQILEYVGDNRATKKTVGRIFPIHLGIVGKAFRTGEISRLERNDVPYEQYLQQLKNAYAYTDEAAKSVDISVQSAIAFPLRAEGSDSPIAVIYADAKMSGFFDDPTRNQIFGAAAAGIALFIGKRYT